MRKIFLAIIIIFITVLFFNQRTPALEQNVSINDYSVNQGNLILVNKKLPVQTETKNLTLIPNDFAGNVLINENFSVKPEVLAALKEMLAAAEKAGVSNFQINSAYRGERRQAELFEEYGEALALPAGYSEHQTGLALDIGSTANQMADAKEGKWLKKNAANYGFILRYPDHKTAITEINYEPWHFRYVGLPHSKVMEQKDFVLEEYIDYIKEKGIFQQKVNGKKYVVQYVAKGSDIKIPNGTYEVSGNNRDGYVITTEIN